MTVIWRNDRWTSDVIGYRKNVASGTTISGHGHGGGDIRMIGIY